MTLGRNYCALTQRIKKTKAQAQAQNVPGVTRLLQFLAMHRQMSSVLDAPKFSVNHKRKGMADRRLLFHKEATINHLLLYPQMLKERSDISCLLEPSLLNTQILVENLYKC
jgi:hypothetical protein